MHISHQVLILSLQLGLYNDENTSKIFCTLKKSHKIADTSNFNLLHMIMLGEFPESSTHSISDTTNFSNLNIRKLLCYLTSEVEWKCEGGGK